MTYYVKRIQLKKNLESIKKRANQTLTYAVRPLVSGVKGYQTLKNILKE